VVYGIDDVAACLPANSRVDQYVIDKYSEGFGMMSNDDNDKIIEIDQEDNTMRRIIESVEIVDMQVEYAANGQVCAELYSFIARDAYSPQTRTNQANLGNTKVPSASELRYNYGRDSLYSYNY
jgi:hypothetical protein